MSPQTEPNAFSTSPHVPINPAIHYWGTPVALLTTLNTTPKPKPEIPDPSPLNNPPSVPSHVFRGEDFNISPMSSLFFLTNRAVIGLVGVSQTAQNLLNPPLDPVSNIAAKKAEIVINLPSPSPSTLASINALALTTGTPVSRMPAFKTAMGYASVADKWSHASLSPVRASTVDVPRIKECPVQIEGRVMTSHPLFQGEDGMEGFITIFEIEVLKCWILPELKMEGSENRVDPDACRPTIMCFQEFYGLERGKVSGSRLGTVEEEMYRV